MRFRNMTVGKQQGELARFRVVGGPDNGVVFVITAPRITLGRGEENDIILTDLKASRKHLEVLWQMGAAIVKDLGSTHGFLVNGTKQIQFQLKTGDKVGVGETVLEFVSSGQSGATQMITRTPDQSSRKVGTGNSGLTQFIARPSGSASVQDKAQAAAQNQTFIEKNKKLFLMLMILMLSAGMLPEADKRISGRKKRAYTPVETGDRKPDAAILTQVDYESTQYKSADIYYKLGLRELRSKNFRRALNDFEMASQIYESHPLARVYVARTKEAIKEEAKIKFEEAKKHEAANRFQLAVSDYSYIKRLYESDQSAENYKNATTALEALDKKIKEMEKIQ